MSLDALSGTGEFETVRVRAEHYVPCHIHDRACLRIHSLRTVISVCRESVSGYDDVAPYDIDTVGPSVAYHIVGDDITAIHPGQCNLRIRVVSGSIYAVGRSRGTFYHLTAGIFDYGVVDEQLLTAFGSHDSAPHRVLVEYVGIRAEFLCHREKHRLFRAAPHIEISVDCEFDRGVVCSCTFLTEYNLHALLNSKRLSLRDIDMTGHLDYRAGFPDTLHISG